MEQEAKLDVREFYKQAALHSRSLFHQYYVDPSHSVPFHMGEIFTWFDDVVKSTGRGIALLPRDHLKSTTLAKSIPTQEICKNPNVRILIAQKTKEEAEKSVGAVQELLKSPDIQRDFSPRFKKKGSSRFTLHRSKAGMKDPTMEGVGIGGAITGGHFDFIFIDDPQDVENSRTAGEREHIKQWVKGTLSMCIEPWTVIVVLLTRKHYDDLANDLIRNPLYKVLERKAIIKYPESWDYVTDSEGKVTGVANIKGDYEVLWPEHWPIEKLLLRKHELGSITFNREMQNEPLAQEDARLKAGWLRYYRFAQDTPRPDRPLFPRVWRQRFGFTDLAISLKEESDFFVNISIVIDAQNNIFVEPFTRGRFEFPEQSDIIEKFLDEKKPFKHGVESNGYQLGLVQHLSRRNLRPIIPVKHTRNKEERIIGTLSPLFEAGKIFIHESMQELVEEYLQFPKAAHDDIMDALEGVVALALEHMSREHRAPEGQAPGLRLI